MKMLLTDEQLEASGKLSGCVLANATKTLQQRLRNEGFVTRAEAAANIEAVEESLISLCRSPGFSSEKLKAAVAKAMY